MNRLLDKPWRRGSPGCEETCARAQLNTPERPRSSSARPLAGGKRNTGLLPHDFGLCTDRPRTAPPSCRGGHYDIQECLSVSLRFARKAWKGLGEKQPILRGRLYGCDSGRGPTCPGPRSKRQPRGGSPPASQVPIRQSNPCGPDPWSPGPPYTGERDPPALGVIPSPSPLQETSSPPPPVAPPPLHTSTPNLRRPPLHTYPPTPNLRGLTSSMSSRSKLGGAPPAARRRAQPRHSQAGRGRPLSMATAPRAPRFREGAVT